jgi:hypothetical protein
MNSQVALMLAQRKAYLANKEMFDRLWAEIPLRVNPELERFRVWSIHNDVNLAQDENEPA